MGVRPKSLSLLSIPSHILAVASLAFSGRGLKGVDDVVSIVSVEVPMWVVGFIIADVA